MWNVGLAVLLSSTVMVAAVSAEDADLRSRDATGARAVADRGRPPAPILLSVEIVPERVDAAAASAPCAGRPSARCDGALPAATIVETVGAKSTR